MKMFKESENSPGFYGLKNNMGLPHFFCMMGEIEDEKVEVQQFLFRSTLKKYFVFL